jgi:hypothetical protein
MRDTPMTTPSSAARQAVTIAKTKIVDRLDNIAAKLVFIGTTICPDNVAEDREKAGLYFMVEDIVKELDLISLSVQHVQKEEDNLDRSDISGDRKPYQRLRPI